MDKALSAPLVDAAPETGREAQAPLRLVPDLHAQPSAAAAWAAWVFPSAQRHRRLLRHYALGDWDRVRVLARALRGASARRPELDFELDLHLAGIYARDHALADALARLEPWRARLTTRPGAFDAAVSQVHLMAGDTGGHVAALARAHRQAPQEPVRRIELALAEARFGDLAHAEALLGDANVPAAALQGRVAWTRGLLQLRGGRPEAAAITLGGAVAPLAAEAAAHEAWIPLAACACDHAIALHQAGRSEAARARIAAAWPVLQHHATVPLLRMLDADGLLPTRTPPNT
jgi:hypothetical protein